MSAFKAGTVAVATVRGYDEPIRVFRSGSGWQGPDSWLSESRVTDVRPLVVLDPASLERPKRGGDHNFTAAELARMMRLIARADGGTYRADVIRELADQIEAQTKPPRIPEPTGFAPVVEAGVAQHAERLRWSRNEQGYWFCQNEDEYARNWGELVDPVLVRDGIKDGA